MRQNRKLSVYKNWVINRWFARMDKPGWRMERGPYWFKWIAYCAFPVTRWFW